MKKYIIERNILGVDKLSPEEYKGAAAASNVAPTQLTPRVQWVESYVAKDMTFPVYLAEDEAVILEHAKLSGLPASRSTEACRKIDPMTAEG
jgi:hypothetical protein